MKKTYEAPVVEKIEFDYSETVTASSSKGGRRLYRDDNEWYTCDSSLVADNPCGLELSGGVQVSNNNYDCGN